MTDKVYKYFSSRVEADAFLKGQVVLRTSYFYEMLEYAGDTHAGDALERTHSGFSSSEGASTWRSFGPKFMACFSNSVNWKDDVVWVEVDSSEALYGLVREKVRKDFADIPLMIGSLKCLNVDYLGPDEIHQLNIERHKSNEGNRKPPPEVKRKHYAYQDEWRIVFEAAGKNGDHVGEQMEILLSSRLGQFLEKEKARFGMCGSPSYEEVLSGFREIRLDLGSLHHIARIC